MWIIDEALKDFGGLDTAEIRVRLRRDQPEPGAGRCFWWENTITRALNGMYRSETAAARRGFARLACAATEEAVDQAALGKREGAMRIASLAAFYLGAGGEKELFDVDSVVARCLDLIEVPFEVAVEQVRDWRALPIEQIRTLRDAKNLIAPCALIADRVTDRALLDRLSAWLHLRGDLP